MKTLKLLPVLGLLLATGCNLTPKLDRPAAPVPPDWGRPAQEGAPQAAALNWKEYITDPGMRTVIQIALDHNLDLRAAALNVEKAQATYRIQRGNILPTVGVQGTSTNYRVSERQASDGQAYVYRQNTAYAVGVSWELDFFGRLRSLKDQALNTYLATEQAHQATQISLVATVAQAYLQCAADAECLALAQSTLEAHKATLDMQGKSYEVGVASELDLKQTQSQVESAQVEEARYKRLVALDRNALDLLAGQSLSANLLPLDLSRVQELKDVSAGLSSQALLGRPDILMAEYQLRAANANIGVARAAFFPSISLTSALGAMSSEVSGLFQSGSRTWLFTPTMQIPLFSGGSLWANLKVSKVSKEIAVADYQKAIQTGFREVADGLVTRESLVDQVKAQQALVASLDTAHKLAKARYEAGMDGYLNVLVTQRSLFSAQQALVATRLAQQTNQITLYKALGGRL